MVEAVESESTEAISEVERRKRVRRNRCIAVTVILVLFVLPLLVFFVGPLSLHIYDAGHVRTVICTVDSARTGSESARSLKGVGSTGSQVVIETSDCGKLLLQERVNAKNADALADELDTGGKFSFTVGSGSFAIRSLLHSINLSPSVTDYKRVP